MAFENGGRKSVPAPLPSIRFELYPNILLRLIIMASLLVMFTEFTPLNGCFLWEFKRLNFDLFSIPLILRNSLVWVRSVSW